MAELTQLESKIGEVIGLAQAAKGDTDKARQARRGRADQGDAAEDPQGRGPAVKATGAIIGILLVAQLAWTGFVVYVIVKVLQHYGAVYVVRHFSIEKRGYYNPQHGWVTTARIVKILRWEFTI